MKKLALAAVLAISASFAQATPIITYAGSWHVGDGPNWSTNPLAYSGTGAAQMLFGAGTYYISTVSDQVADINHMAHYAIIGIGFQDFSESYFRGVEGVTHYQDVYVYDASIDTVSTYVRDFGAGGINYAFRVVDNGTDLPEPASLALFGLGMLGAAAARRKALAK